MMRSSPFGRHVRQERETRGLSLEAVAGQLGISYSYLSRIETDPQLAMPSERIIYGLAKVLEQDVDLLLHLAGRLSDDLRERIVSDRLMPEFLRRTAVAGLSGGQLIALLDWLLSGEGRERLIILRNSEIRTKEAQ